ncbi:archaellum operon transcriptional activator EarA family protein [Methanosarcina sp.]|uniref:archaellum operon transcriptional activator EarA family protein n=1 Tax=Methanosarcina sp. TaxID=2213 RepID=UPI00298812B2|nr:archaellum operon transcriptional activator EarA family protein [Methanosarcina sp.]MDW5551474.1 archaellum operon transcriptional activator EarA family protein [Methanosarcina sp.]MDW5554388.1 archaellum operon transcriptional activator EarA family protein [Methanosarcina sp.]MDW5560627.1 archaellum operon transcriptional activator EarA family protein [Methanosarcina sp.]
MNWTIEKRIGGSKFILKHNPKVILSLTRSGVRRSILMYLYEIYPQASYPAEIARRINAHPMSVIGGLKGINNRYDISSSLLKLEMVFIVEENGSIFYKLSEIGKEIAEDLQ